MICALSFRERLAPASRNVHIYGAENSFLTDFEKEIQLYMKCQGCGEQIPEGKIYCEKCGMAVQMVPDYNPVEDIAIGAEEEPEEPPLVRESGWHRWRFLLAGMLLSVFGFGSFQIAYHMMGPVEEAEAEPAEVPVRIGKPRFSVQPGTYSYAPMLGLFPSGNEQGKIHYTTDGTTPDERSSIYDSPFSIQEGTTVVRAVFIREDGIQSEEACGTYDVVFDYPDEPVFSIPAGTYEEGLSVTISAEEGCRIYYTTNGEEPGRNSKLYQGPVYIAPGLTVLQAVSMDKEGGMSAIVEAIYHVAEPPEASSEEENGLLTNGSVIP